MKNVIHLLPDSIANQIAAGEVVQRPSSVVKELMENAIDAEAGEINVIIKDAGKTLVQVIDDGVGMSETDARMSLERHATSKIKTAEDLFKLTSMGFRGEAMASIAAVSQMQMRTRVESRDIGTQLEVDSSEVKSQSPVACKPGTSVSVKNLFFNIPARRNFLKSNGVEMRHIVEEFQRVALSRPDVSFSLFQNDLATYQLSVGKLNHRIVQLFGKNYKEQLAAVNESTPHLEISGFIGKPESAKRTRGEQFIFVNNRYIKSGYLNHAVTSAYEGLIPKDQFPFYVLFIRIDPANIDVNVHPTKTEIKFIDERTVYAIVRSAVKQALGAHNLSPSIDFDLDVNFGKQQSGITDAFSNKDYGQFRTPFSKTLPGDIKNLENLYENVLQQGVSRKAGSEEVELTFQSSANKTGAEEIEYPEGPEGTNHVFTYQLHGRYIITQVKPGMMLIDINKAHERILFEKYLNRLSTRKSASQRSLFPQTVTFNPSNFALLEDIRPEIKILGFDLEDFGKNSVIINGYPSDLSDQDSKQLLEGLIEQYKIFKSELTLPKEEHLARSLARRSAIKPGKILGGDEMNAIIDNLFACKTPNFSPDGQLTFFILDLNKIESLFN